MKLIIDINEEVYSDTIHDSEYDTLQLGITLKEIIKNGIPLEEELEKLKTEFEKMPEEYIFKTYSLKTICEDVNKIIDNHIKELKGENNAKNKTD